MILNYVDVYRNKVNAQHNNNLKLIFVVVWLYSFVVQGIFVL